MHRRASRSFGRSIGSRARVEKKIGQRITRFHCQDMEHEAWCMFAYTRRPHELRVIAAIGCQRQVGEWFVGHYDKDMECR